MLIRNFTIQFHQPKKSRPKPHWDLRIVSPGQKTAWSWTIPKMKFPSSSRERLLAIQTPNHPISYMTFHGKLNNGDKVDLIDQGTVKFLKIKKNQLYLEFSGDTIKGSFYFIHMKNDQWLILKG